ncbi:MAG: XdhC family protein [Myxococcales bacterium]|nr:XdhC family protein [Myxococcales bacterium]
MTVAARAVLARLGELGDTGAVVITLVAARGSAPQEVGAKALVTASGLDCGTVGGGKLEAAAVRHATTLLGTGQVDLVTWNLQTDIGMTCGGVVTVLFEAYGPAPWRIALFGAGHVAQAVARLLVPLDCQVDVIDPRPDWLAKLPSAPNLRARLDPAPARLVAGLPDGTFVAALTQGHATDLPVLTEALRWGRFGYLGAIGSAVKASRLRRELEEAGLDPSPLHCPIGLPIGRSEPAEIAISIVAQLLEIRDRRGAGGAGG